MQSGRQTAPSEGLTSEPEGGPPLPRLPNLLLIGSSGRDCGKTLLGERIIQRVARERPIVAAKVTTVRDHHGSCPRGGEGCGACDSLDAPFTLEPETDATSGKDTARLLAAGARSVWWLRTRQEVLREAAHALHRRLGTAAALCESNSLRQVIEPGLFVIVRRRGQRRAKASARRVWDLADAIIDFDGGEHVPAVEDFDFSNGRWTLRRPMTAIILAGGRSTRMGRDKALLPFAGRTMIEHIVAQLRPHFAQLLVSANDPERYAFLGLEIVKDHRPGLGPMGALEAALPRARYERCFVVPCDAPVLPESLMLELLKLARRGADVVVPRTTEGRHEPLFAVYSRALAGDISAALDDGQRRIVALYPRWNTQVLELAPGQSVRNVNTMDEYERLLAEMT